MNTVSCFCSLVVLRGSGQNQQRVVLINAQRLHSFTSPHLTSVRTGNTGAVFTRVAGRQTVVSINWSNIHHVEAAASEVSGFDGTVGAGQGAGDDRLWAVEAKNPQIN